jgi:hypothetical protein
VKCECVDVSGTRLTRFIHPEPDPEHVRPLTRCTANRRRAGAPHLQSGIGWHRTVFSVRSCGEHPHCALSGSQRLGSSPQDWSFDASSDRVQSSSYLHAFPVASTELALVVHRRPSYRRERPSGVAGTSRAPNHHRSHETSKYAKTR